MKPKNQKSLTFRQAEQLTGISSWTWRNWRYKNRIESFMVGRVVVIPLAEVKRMTDQMLATRAQIQRPNVHELGAAV